MCFFFPLTVFWNSSHAVKKWVRNGQKSTLVFTYSTRYFVRWMTKLLVAFHNFANAPKKDMEAGYTNPGRQVTPDDYYLDGGA